MTLFAWSLISGVVDAGWPVLALCLGLAVLGTVLTADAGVADGAGPGSQPDDTGADPGDAGDPSASPAAGVADGSDDDDPDGFDESEYADPDLERNPTGKRAVNRLRKLSKWKARHAPFMQQLRALGIKDPAEIHRLVTRAQHADTLEQQLAQNPKLRRLVGPDDDDHAQDADKTADAPFDEKSFPFDRTAPGSDWLLAQAKELHGLKQLVTRELRELRRLAGGTAQTIQQEREARETGAWKSAVDAAASKVPEKVNGIPVRQMFRDAVAGAFAYARRNNIRVQPAQVITHYLGEFGLSKGQQQLAAQAASQRIAEGNRNLPRAGVIAGKGQPTTPQKHKLNVYEVSRRLRGQR